MLRNRLHILFFFLAQFAFAQNVNVFNIVRTGNFNCGSAPNITAEIITSEGSAVVDGALVITDPCGFTTLRITMNNLRYDQPGVNWPHGFFFPTGDNVTVANVNLPAGWIYQDSCTGATCSAQQTGGVGFYYDANAGSSCCTPVMNDGIPNNNFGQSSMSCNTPFMIAFDMTFCNSQIETETTNFTLQGTSDGNTGCWSIADTNTNTVTFSINTVESDVPLFDPAPSNTEVATICEGSDMNYQVEVVGGCGNDNDITWWTDEVGGTMLGTGSPFIYEVPDECPEGTVIYAQCCPQGTDCDSRTPVVIGACTPPSEEPIFNPVPPQCPGGDNPLPETSTEGYTGTWSPPFDPYNTTTYTFTPDEGQCATEPVTLVVEITDEITPTFQEIEPLCQNSEAPELPDSNEGITGTWVPSVIDTSEIGTTTYTFTPDEGQCALTTTLTVTVTESMLAEFDIQNEYCQGADPEDLPLTSDNGIPGTWFPAVIDTSTPGTTTYTFTPDNPECVSGIEIQIEITTGVELNQLNNIPICDDDMDGTWNYNLATLNSQLISPTTGITFSYYTSLTNAQNDNPIPSSQWANYSFTSLPATIWVIATSSDGCRSEEIAIQFVEGQEVQHSTGPYEIDYCEGFAIDLTEFESDMALESGISFTYYETLANAQNETNPVVNEADYHAEGDGTIFVRLEKSGRCAVIIEITYELRPKPSIEGLEPLQRVICDGDTIEVEASSDDTTANYVWEWGNQTLSSPVITITEPGIYTLTVTGDNGCESSEQLVVTAAAQPTITSVESGTDYLIVYVQSGGGLLEYSLNGVIWQSSPRFDNLVKGETYTVYVREDGCMIDSYKVVILSVPNFVSPNGDGYNDVWEVRGIEVTPKATIKIFDRYGKIFVDTNFDGNYVWDGKYMGNPLPSGDYWYIMDIPSDGVVKAKKFVGHISIRN